MNKSFAADTKCPSGNIEPLLHEIRHALRRVAEGREGTVIDLSRLPLAPGEEKKIEAVLGHGEVRAEIDALGPTLVRETAYPGVWLVTHQNPDQTVVARFIEVTRIPELLKSQEADIERGICRLEEELELHGSPTTRPVKIVDTKEARNTG